MHNKHSSKLAAFLAAVAMTATGLPELNRDAAQKMVKKQANPPQAQSGVVEFAEQLDEIQIPKTVEENQISELTFEPKKGFAVKKGVYTPQCGNFFVENGSVRMKTANGGSVSLEEAEKRVGCEVKTDKEGKTTISMPFATARLVVKAEESVDSTGACSVVEGFRNLHVLQYQNAEEAYQAYCTFREDEKITYVMPDRICQLCEAETEEQDDMDAPSEAKASFGVPQPSWGVDYVGANDFYTDYLQELEVKNDLPEIKVAVIDTGIYSEHTWFENRIAEGGKSFVAEAYDSFNDGHMHGSHCAGIVCSVTDDNVKILPIKVGYDSGLIYTLDVYCGMLYAVEQGADVISISLGGPGETPLWDEAIDVIREADIPLCVAAGNASEDSKYFSPSQNPYCFTIAAIDELGEPAEFTNYGEGIDFAAPGVDILSAYISDPNATVSASGTSMAAPFVAGCCAAILSVQPELSVAELEAYLRANALDLGDAGFDTTYGWGVVNLKDFRFDETYVERPTFSRCSSNLNEPFVLELSCKTEGATIVYTLDNSVPTPTHGTVYTEPIAVWRSQKVRAIAYKGDVCSAETSEVYCIRGEETSNALLIDGDTLVSYDGFLQEIDLNAYPEMEGVTKIGDGAFMHATESETIIFPDTVTTFGKNVFRNNGQLKKITANGIQEIGASCFRACTALETFEGISNLTVYPEYAFSNAKKLTVPIKGVTEIGDYAVEFTNIASEAATDFAELRTIGSCAFDASKLVKCQAADFSGVTSFADAALADSLFKEITLPADMTEIPSYLLYGCVELTWLSAPAITKICEYGLALCKGNTYDMTGLPPCDTDIDFENKVTEAEDYAFMGFYFARDVRFDALSENTSIAAFQYAIGGRISLPTIKRVEMAMNDFDEFPMAEPVCIIADVLILENVEVLEDNALFLYNALVIGDKLTECLPGSVHMYGDCVIAGPEGCFMQQYAEKYGYTFQSVSSVVRCPEIIQVEQGEPFRAVCGLLDWEMTGKWTALDENGERTENVIEGAELIGSFENVGTYQYVFDAYFANCKLCGTYPLTVEVLPCNIPEIGLNETIFVDAETMANEYGMVELRYCPEEDVTVKVWSMDGYVDLYDGHRYLQMFSMHEGGDAAIVSLEAGKVYTFAISQTHELSVFRLSSVDEQYECIGMTNMVVLFDEALYRDLREENLPLTHEMLHEQVEWVIYDDSYEYYETVPMEYGVDYDILIKPLDNAVYVCIYGIGKYFGSYCETFSIVHDLSEDVPVSCASGQFYTYTFTPQTSDTYRFMMLLPEETLEAGDVHNNWNEFYYSLNIIEKESYENVLAYESDWRDVLNVDLLEGVTYCVNAVFDTMGETNIELMVTRSLNTMGDIYINYDYDMLRQANIEDIPQLVSLTTLDGEPLEYGTDYKIYCEDVSVGRRLVFFGMGNYIGQYEMLLWDYQSPVQIPFDEEFVFDVQDGNDRLLTLEEPTVLHFEAALPFKSLRLLVINYNDYSIGDVYDYDIMQEDVALDAGTYILQFDTIGMVHVTMTAVGTAESILDAEIVYDKIIFADDDFDFETIPVSVVYQGEELVPDVDYSLLNYDYYSSLYGTHMMLLRGRGRFFGSDELVTLILPKDPTRMADVVEGTNTINIENKNDSVCMKWIPTAENAVFKYSGLDDVMITVFDAESNILADGNGKLLGQVAVDVTIGETYFIVASYTNFANTGSFDLTLGYHQKDLSDCEVIQLSEYAYSGEDVTPFIHFVDGNKLLKPGKDYELFYDGNTNGIGWCEYVFYGIGDYYGFQSVEMKIYDDFDLSVDTTPLYLDDDVMMGIAASYPGETFQFSFTNYQATEQRYRLNYISDIGTDPFCFLFYDEDLNYLYGTEDSMTFTLAFGETCYIKVVAPSIYTDAFRPAGFITVQPDYDVPYLLQNGVYYENRFGKMYANECSYELKGVVITNEVTAEDGTVFSVGGIDPYILYMLADSSKALFYEPGVDVSEAVEIGVQCVPLSDEVLEVGDIDLNGVIDMTDVTILSILIGEGGSLQGAMVQRADFNGDGNLDLNDLIALTKACMQTE